VARRIKELQAKWKEIGPLPRDDSQPMWQRFHAACERNFARAKEFFAEQDRKREAAKERKQALVAEAESLAESTDYQATAERLKAMQAEWKSLPFAPRESEDELYQRFRAVCNAFFERRREAFKERDEQRREAGESKEALCQQAEAYAAKAGS